MISELNTLKVSILINERCSWKRMFFLYSWPLSYDELCIMATSYYLEYPLIEISDKIKVLMQDLSKKLLCVILLF